MDILAAHRSEDVNEPRLAHLPPNHLERERQVSQETRKTAARTRMGALPFDDVTLNGDDFTFSHGRVLEEPVWLDQGGVGLP